MRYLAILMAGMMAGAWAQSAPDAGGPYGNPDVVVHPAGPNSQVVLYPGGEYGRVIRHDLLEPGDPRGPTIPEAKIVSHHREDHHAPAQQNPPPKPLTVSPEPHRTEPPKSQTEAHHEAPKPVNEPAPQPQKVARLEPAKPVQLTRGTIAFASAATDPRGSAADISKLAETLSSALSDGRLRVQITAYAGPKGNTAAESRRLSLKRALIVRQLLVDGGIPSGRIDIRAVGGAQDNGAPDRVDVTVKG